MKSQRRVSTSALPAFLRPVSSHPLSPVSRARRGGGLVGELGGEKDLCSAGHLPTPSFAVNPAAREGAVLLNPLGKGGGS